MRITNARVLTPDGIIENGAIRIEDGIIAEISRKAAGMGEDINAKGGFVAPGFIDLHIHGKPEKISAREVKFGTTSFLLGSAERIPAAIEELGEMDKPRGARALGLYLEGPYLNPKMRGALPSGSLRSPNLAEAGELVEKFKGHAKVIVIAPELKGAIAVIKIFRKHGVRVSLGHTDATYEEAKRGIDAGAALATHTFNRMRALDHREPGAAGSVLDDNRVYAEVLLDGVHIHPAAFRILLRCKGRDRVILVTDSVASGPLPGSVRRGGVFQLGDGTFAGSALTMNRALENAVDYGATLADAVNMAALNPARFLGIDKKKGSIERGKDADIVVFDEKFNVKLTMVKGLIVYRA